jgi:hypothetical protein
MELQQQSAQIVICKDNVLTGKAQGSGHAHEPKEGGGSGASLISRGGHF